MDGYPRQYIEHNVPVVALSGIGESSVPEVDQVSSRVRQSSGTKVTVNWPALPEPLAAHLLEAFQSSSSNAAPWSGGADARRPGLNNFNCYAVGRSLSFPRRKAAPAPQAPSGDPSIAGSGVPSINHDLHSPLSPLSPTSSLFPDGLMTPEWLDKHQRCIASVLLCFFPLSTDATTMTLKDNELKGEVSNIKSALSKSGFRTRLAVVLVSDQTLSQDAAALEDRISIIRRASGLDIKSTFFHLSSSAQTDLSSFALDVLSALQPVCIDYYRDLTKHARRKKTRGYIPPPTGTAENDKTMSLTFQDWHARYEFKQGVFAEFRQEMDVAERHYIFAMDELFNPEGALETTQALTARWNEARQLADVTTLRIVRCQLWRGLTSTAAETWYNYRDRTRSLVGRRTKGSSPYDHAAWESSFAECMAQLIQRAALPVFRIPETESHVPHEIEDDEADGTTDWVAIQIFAPPERSFPNAEKQMLPSRYLHHAGYWYRTARKWALERLQRAESIQAEDSLTPDLTKSNNKLERRPIHDTYMAPLPHIEVSGDGKSSQLVLSRIEQLDIAAAHEHALRRQFRVRSHILLDQAQILVQLGKGDRAINLLRPVWVDMTWRKESWWDLAAKVLAALHDMAGLQQDYDTLVQVRWEMTCDAFGTRFNDQLAQSLGPLPSSSTPVLMDSEHRLSPLTAALSFGQIYVNVGDDLPCQLVLHASSESDCMPKAIEKLRVCLNDGAWLIEIVHEPGTSSGESQEVSLQDFLAEDRTRKTTGRADLGMSSGSRRVLNLGLHLREPGELSATSIQIMASFYEYAIHYTLADQARMSSPVWYLEASDGLIARRLDRKKTHIVEVQPKPPKLQVYLAETKAQYLTSDDITLGLVLYNEEDDSVSGHLHLDMASDILSAIDARWQDLDDGSGCDNQLQRTFDTLGPGEQRVYPLSFRAPADSINLPLSVSVDYVIRTDQDSPVQKTTTFNFKFVQPFDLGFDLEPRYDAELWPSFFNMPLSPSADEAHGQGIRQSWSLRTSLTALAAEPIHVDSIELHINKTSENVVCNLSDPLPNPKSGPLTQGSKHHLQLPFSTRKKSLEDRRSSSLSLGLTIRWRRASSPADKPPVTMTVKVPTLHNPAAEPRVLCTSAPLPPLVVSGAHEGHTESDDRQDGGRLVRYTLENPSLHHLVFTVAMDASDAFAFSGPKSRAVTLPPLSRADVTYGLILVNTSDADLEIAADDNYNDGRRERKGKWVYPVLRVQDAYFMKSLRVLVAGDGVRADERRVDGDGRAGAGVGVWIPVAQD